MPGGHLAAEVKARCPFNNDPFPVSAVVYFEILRWGILEDCALLFPEKGLNQAAVPHGPSRF